MDEIIGVIKDSARAVTDELGGEWSEAVYQKALEVELRLRGIDYECQRVLPIIYRGFNVGEGKPDIIVWQGEGKKRAGIVVELKNEASLKKDHIKQLTSYIAELKRQGLNIYDEGLLINFKKSGGKKVEECEREEGLEFMVV
ncbi:MAG TPA: GxxExxY protein [Firmicutes bacterium]|nr:GxxExxY protein [Bacillota bacterium]